MKTLSGFLLVLFVTVNVLGQKDWSNLNLSLSNLQKKSGLPGFAVAIVDENGAIYKGGFGFADVKRKTPYTTKTIQPIASVSKTFIGVALMRAVEMNLFSLETNVNDILPFKIYNPYHPQNEIKIKHLAAHTSGIVDREEIYEKTYLKAAKPNVSLARFFKDYLTVGGKYYNAKNFDQSEAGAAFNYTNIGAALAAYLIEVKSRVSFDEFTRRYLFVPLEMNQTKWFYDETKRGDYATLYGKNSEPLQTYSSITYPDGSLKTSVEDLSKYLSEIIRGFDSKGKLLSNESYQTLFDKQFSAENMPLKINPKEPNQGIFFVHRQNSHIGHTGSDYGVSAFMFFNPQTKIGKIFITNTDIAENPKLAAQFTQIWRTLEEYETLLH